MFVATFEAGGRRPGRRGHSDLPGRGGGGGGGGRPMPVQQMITMVMTVLPSSPLTDTSPGAATRHRWPGGASPTAAARTSPGASPGRAHHRCAQSVSGSAGWRWSSTLPAAAPLALGPRIRCHRRYPLRLPACERWTVHARRDAPLPLRGTSPGGGRAGWVGRAHPRAPRTTPITPPDASPSAAPNYGPPSRARLDFLGALPATWPTGHQRVSPRSRRGQAAFAAEGEGTRWTLGFRSFCRSRSHVPLIFGTPVWSPTGHGAGPHENGK